MRTSGARLPFRLALCGLLAGLTVARPAPAGATSASMALHEGLLSADVAGTPVSRVMEEVGRLTGAEVRWLGAAGEEPVSVRFSDVPLTDAIGRLLGTRSFLLVASGPGASPPIIRVVILASGERPGLEPEAPRVPSEDAERALDAAVATALAPEAPAVRLHAIDELARVAQQEPQAWMVLTELSRLEPDRTVGAAARRALGAGA